MQNPDQFLNKAKACVIEAVNRDYPAEQTSNLLIVSDLYIVWFVKALGNWKALISTDRFDGFYWEVTYNGAKKEAYVDMYKKQTNHAVSDDPEVSG